MWGFAGVQLYAKIGNAVNLAWNCNIACRCAEMETAQTKNATEKGWSGSPLQVQHARGIGSVLSKQCEDGVGVQVILRPFFAGPLQHAGF
jgi:hypothetical protein